MTTKTNIIRGGAFALALAGGAAAGAMLGVPSVSGAQDDTSTTTEESATAVPESGTARGPGPFGHRGERLETVAELLGIEVEDLRAALSEGQSVAEVAEANGVDPQTVIDQLVADGTERLEELIAALPDRVTEMVNKDDWGDRIGEVRGGPFPGRGPGGFGDHAPETDGTGSSAEDDAA